MPIDYDAYFKAVNGQVNDMFYYYREQAALKARQYQRALDDIAKAIELNPKDLTYKAEQAVVNLRVGRYEEAVQILNNILINLLFLAFFSKINTAKSYFIEEEIDGQKS